MQHALVRLFAPVLAFTCEEAWSHMRRLPGDPDSVHLALAPEPEELTAGLPEEHARLSADWDRLMEVREVVLKALEEARNAKLIGAPLEAKVLLEAGDDLYPLLERYRQELPSIFITSQVELRRGEALRARVERADGAKCERCWKYTTDIGSDSALPTICAACAAAVREIAGA